MSVKHFDEFFCRKEKKEHILFYAVVHNFETQMSLNISLQK